MRFLLDTCVVLWYFTGSERIGEDLRNQLTDSRNEIWVSDVSVMEVVIKFRLGKLQLPKPPSHFFPQLIRRHGLSSLSISAEAIYALEQLPNIHRDPFDRLLIAQAMTADCTLVSPDAAFSRYEVNVVF